MRDQVCFFISKLSVTFTHMKLKSLFTSCLLLLCSIAFGQTWENLGNPSMQRTPTVRGYQYRFNAGAKGFVYFSLPNGLQGQILRNTLDNGNTYTAQEPLVYGNFVYTDAQLTRALAAGQATQLQIFNSFKRFSHGGSPTVPTTAQQNNTIPGQPLQTNSWAYDTTAARFNSTFNSGSTIGVVSPTKYSNYTHTVTIGANDGSNPDNDRIGLVIAYVEGPDSVVNNAYGLNPADFNWPIDVTHHKVLNQHTLSVYRNRDPIEPKYFIVYDYWKLTQKIIADGSALSGLYNTTANWSGNTLDMQVVRSGDTIVTKISQFTDAPGGKGSLAFPLTVNLNSDTVLTKFKGMQSYGYSIQSQAFAFFSNINFSGSNNNIYDLRNGDTYNFTGSSYILDPTKNMYNDLGVRFFWRDTTEQTYGYILPTKTYDVIVQQGSNVILSGSASLNFPSTAAGSSSSLNITVPGVSTGDVVSLGLPVSFLPGGQNYSFQPVCTGTDTVAIIFFNNSGSSIDPNPALFRVKVFK